MIDPWALSIVLYALGFFQSMAWSSEGNWGVGHTANLKFWFSVAWPLLMLAAVGFALFLLIKRSMQ